MQRIFFGVVCDIQSSISVERTATCPSPNKLPIVLAFYVVAQSAPPPRCPPRLTQASDRDSSPAHRGLFPDRNEGGILSTLRRRRGARQPEHGPVTLIRPVVPEAARPEGGVRAAGPSPVRGPRLVGGTMLLLPLWLSLLSLVSPSPLWLVLVVVLSHETVSCPNSLHLSNHELSTLLYERTMRAFLIPFIRDFVRVSREREGAITAKGAVLGILSIEGSV